MDKQYKNLMQQQDIGAETTAQFYEKLEKTETRRKPIRWKVALAAACIALMIPLTAFAVEHIFRVPEVKLGDTIHFTNMNGYMVRFDDMENYPLSAFPEDVQTITEHTNKGYSSWEEAEQALGIDLLNNAVLAKASKCTVRYDDTGETHCVVRYRTLGNQLYYVATKATYKCDSVQLDLKAKLTVENPKITEEDKLGLHGIEGASTNPENVEITYENYYTKEGIPVVILRWDYGHTIRNKAVFAVNDISYELDAWDNEEREENARKILFDVLEGFELK